MHLFKLLAKGGPLGLVHSMREAWVARRIQQVTLHMEMERDLHRQAMDHLRFQQRRLLDLQRDITYRAATYWRSLS